MKDLTRNKKLLIFSVFFLLSAILWLLDSLNQYYKTSLNLPIEYKQVPKHKIIAPEVPRSLTIKVDGYGYDLLKYTLATKLKPLYIDLGEVALNPIIPYDTNNFYILTKQLENQINSQLTGKIKILDINPDTIFIHFIPLYEKTVPVKPNLKISYAKQYINKTPPKIEPGKVKVIGPANILDTLKQIYTEPIVLQNIQNNIDKTVKLLIPKGTKVYPTTVHLTIEVEQYTEMTILVPLKTINVPPKYDLKVFPNKVRIKYTVGFSNYNKITADNFVAVVDYNDIKHSVGDKLPVHIIHVPDEIYDYTYSPHTVDYIIEVKND